MYSGSINQPKLKLNNFDGNTHEWPEGSSMFMATVDQRPKPDSEKMSLLKTVQTGIARPAISGMGYSGLWTFLLCYMEHSVEEVWKASCNH